MFRRLLTWIVLSCLSFGFAQGVRGNVKVGGKVTLANAGHSVTLTWNASKNASSYNVYRGSSHGGPYVKLASGIAGLTFTDVSVVHNQTFYYVTTALMGKSESGYSNETVAAIP
jgi:fibronectin type 3 domain-containing protein